MAVLVSDCALYAKVDRPANQVCTWVTDIALALAKHTCPTHNETNSVHTHIYVAHPPPHPPPRPPNKPPLTPTHTHTHTPTHPPTNQVTFAKPRIAEEALSDWAADIAKLLTLVERTTHLISKEQMVHKVVVAPQAAAAAAAGGSA